MSETAYWVWLQCALGEGAAVQPLLEEFGSAKAVYDANIMEWRMTPALTKYQVQHLESTPLSAADKVLSTCKQQGWQMLPYDHPDFPACCGICRTRRWCYMWTALCRTGTDS